MQNFIFLAACNFFLKHNETFTIWIKSKKKKLSENITYNIIDYYKYIYYAFVR